MTRKNQLRIFLFIMILVIPFGGGIIMFYCAVRYFLLGEKFTKEMELLNAIFKQIDKYIENK
jgi:hypothetical protein